MDPAFSRPGEAPTPFERELLAAIPRSEPKCASELWLVVAQAIGLDALMRMLDEFGDAHVWIPSRHRMIQSLWVDQRDSEIRRLRHEQRLSLAVIAERLCVSRKTVLRVARRRHGSAPPKRGTQGR